MYTHGLCDAFRLPIWRQRAGDDMLGIMRHGYSLQLLPDIEQGLFMHVDLSAAGNHRSIR